ncbi:hypothetical protein [Leclercia adecarboxylata]|uniref:hypothetical protein n=1 Tax=Leclercia adecarboxylata TaxID=83655 RepID=UPI003016CC94
MSNREQFEQAVKGKFDDLIDYRVRKNGDGEYMAWDMQVAWFAWQAATSAMEAKCAALAAELKQSQIDSGCYKKGMEASNERLVQVAAELSAVDAIHNEAVFITDHHYEQCPKEVQKIIRSLAVMQIPAYKAFLAEVRAQGVELFAREMHADISEADAIEFAAQLRQETVQ